MFDGERPLTALAPLAQQPLQFLRGTEGSFGAQPKEEIARYTAHGREVQLTSDSISGESFTGCQWRFQVEGIVSFYWFGGAHNITYILHENGTDSLCAFWFIHIFLPLFLTLERDYDFIHAASVEVEGRPVLLIAPSMGGKSTLGDFFLSKGHTMLSDDKVATFCYEHQYWAIPSHPHHRPYREFEVLGQYIENYAQQSGVLQAIFLLEQCDLGCSTFIKEISGFKKFEQLMPNYLFEFSFLQERRLRWLSALADQVPVFQVNRPWGLERLEETYTAITAECRLLRNGRTYDPSDRSDATALV
ncbi:MAG: hypothetical protein ABJN62_19380 [Halioglobus sp.]